MIPIALSRVAEIVSGTLDAADPGARVTGPVVIDSRKVTPGSLFVAIKGERADGHDFAEAAIADGAAAVLTTRPAGVPAVVVSDPVAALAALASAVAAELRGMTVVGVTGSSGKTTTKDLIAALARRLGPTVAAVGSYNNEIGHPLTVLRATGETRYLVLELSARNIGHIAELTKIAPPTIGAVLNVGSAHLGVFGGVDAIARAKGELVEALPEDGVAVLNADDPAVAAMVPRTTARVVTFGQAQAEADIRAEDITLDSRGRAGFTLVTPEAREAVRLRMPGAHIVEDALAAAAVARELGVPVAEIAQELTAAEPASRWRMEVTECDDGFTVINDAYNANPQSMRAALEALAVIGGSGPKIAVLGPMAELGEAGDEENARAGRMAVQLGVDTVIAVGQGAEPIVEGAREEGAATAVHSPDIESARREVELRAGPGVAVLVKGSRVTNLQEVAEALLKGRMRGAGAQ